MPYTKAISQVSNSYLTKGKEYEILELGGVYPTYGQSFKIKDNKGLQRWMYQNQSDFSLITRNPWKLRSIKTTSRL